MEEKQGKPDAGYRILPLASCILHLRLFEILDSNFYEQPLVSPQFMHL